MSPEDPAGASGQFSLMDLDDDTVDRILEEPDPSGAPAGYANATRVLAAASVPPTAEELAAEALVLAAYRQVIVDEGWRPRWRRILARGNRPRVAAAVLAVALTIDGGVTAAATGALPAPAQRIASEVLGLVGIKVPDPHGNPRRQNSGPDVSSTNHYDGSAPEPVGSSANPSPSSTALDGSRGEASVIASPATTPTRPLATSTTSATGPGSVADRSDGIGTSAHHGVGPVNSNPPGGPPGQSGSNGNGNGNRWGHVNNWGGPPGQSGNNGNGNGNAWGHANHPAGLPGQSGNNGNGNAWGHSNKAAGPPAQSGRPPA